MRQLDFLWREVFPGGAIASLSAKAPPAPLDGRIPFSSRESLPLEQKLQPR